MNATLLVWYQPREDGYVPDVSVLLEDETQEALEHLQHQLYALCEEDMLGDFELLLVPTEKVGIAQVFGRLFGAWPDDARAEVRRIAKKVI